MIGRYSVRWVFGTPFLTNLSQQTMFARNILLDPLTRLGPAALYTALCSMPANQNSDHINVLFSRANSSQLLCLGDFLDHLGGYTVATYEAGGSHYGGLQPTLEKHGLRNIQNFPHDKEMFDALEKALPDLASKQPFVLYISNVDTRPPIHAVCPYRSWLYKNHQQYKAVDCIDQYLEAFFKKLSDVGLNPKNTQIAIFGDGLRGDLNHQPIPLFKDPRRLFAMFPFAPKRYISKQVTLYDITPTLLDLAGIRYGPRPPFGGNVVHAPNGIPTNQDYDAVYKRFSGK
jgi:phosphoglycerol transferase MdoB-like AlkP superfamily enzyme